MAENQPEPVFDLELGEHGDRLVFKTPEELLQWSKDERAKWVWLNEAGRPMTDGLVSSQNQFHGQINQQVERWRQSRSNPSEVNRVLASLRTVFEQYFKQERGLNSKTPAAAFIFELRAKRGDRVAAGGYAGILNAQIQTGGQSRSEFFEGIVEAFLFKREIDWTAAGHQEALNRLKNQYDDEIARQDARFKELEDRNRLLNEAFDAALKEKNELLRKLHRDQTSEFAALVDKHVKNLAAIEKTYDEKLALQKPVKYWHTKEGYHRSKAVLFGWVAPACALAAAGNLGWFAYRVLGNLQPNENPKHWQIGLLVVGAFFAVWLVRVLVRLFFSHLHLATDAAERRMMILTYLAMSRQGTQFAADDKKLIVQHIFRSVSDGLVKDDAAPPSLFEVFTRK